MPEDTSNQTAAPAEPAERHEGTGARVKKIVASVESVLELSRGTTAHPIVATGDIGTSLAHERTDLAMERSYLAAERTLMAWIRTALSMISFGFTMGKLRQAIGGVELRRLLGGNRTVSIAGLAYFLVVLGTAALVAAALQHRRRIRELYEMGFHRQLSVTFYVAVALATVGALALTALVAKL